MTNDQSMANTQMANDAAYVSLKLATGAARPPRRATKPVVAGGIRCRRRARRDRWLDLIDGRNGATCHANFFAPCARVHDWQHRGRRSCVAGKRRQAAAEMETLASVRGTHRAPEVLVAESLRKLRKDKET